MLNIIHTKKQLVSNKFRIMWASWTLNKENKAFSFICLLSSWHSNGSSISGHMAEQVAGVGSRLTALPVGLAPHCCSSTAQCLFAPWSVLHQTVAISSNLIYIQWVVDICEKWKTISHRLIESVSDRTLCGLIYQGQRVWPGQQHVILQQPHQQLYIINNNRHFYNIHIREEYIRNQWMP